MEPRLSHLLRILVDEFISTAEPVGSQSLVDRYRLDVSPATVRNWFSELEEEGFVMQPHTSGGRIPTELGFRTYVSLFVQPKPVSKRDHDQLVKAATIPSDDGRRLKAVSKMLAELSGQACVAGLNEADTFYTGLSQLFTHPEFQNWQRVVSLTEVLDHLDEALLGLRRQRFDIPKVFIGRECPFGPICGTVMVSTGDGLIGILGPMRMDYQYTFSLMQTALEILNA